MAELNTREREQFLAEPQVGVVSVAGEDGRPPLATPVWYAYEPGGNITFFTQTMGRTARKVRLIDKAGKVTFLVQRFELPYKYVSVECSVVQVDAPPSAEQMLAIARRYLPEEHAQGFVAGELGRPNCKLMLYTIRPDRWLTADFSNGSG
jgi:hypothetical protein